MKQSLIVAWPSDGCIYINQFNLASIQAMSVHYRMLNTPLKRHPHQTRTLPNVSAFAYSKDSSAQHSKKGRDREGHDRVLQFNEEGRMQTEPPCVEESNAGSGSRGVVGYSPSLKAQKRQYLKLFSTASTEKDVIHSNNESNRSVKGSLRSQREDQAIFNQSGKDMMIRNKNREGSARRAPPKPPRRRLFGQFVIEEEKRIKLDEIDAGYLVLDDKSPSCSPCQHSNQSSTVCQSCLAALKKQQVSHQYHHLHGVTSLSSKEQLQAMKRRGMGLIRKLQSRSDQLDQLPDHCSAFLKECDLAWSAGRPSEIYNFKLKQLRARNRRLAEWMEDVQRLNQLLVMVETRQKVPYP